MEKISEAIKKHGYEEFGIAVLSNIGKWGLGSLSKSDFEALILHQLDLVVDKTKVKDSFDWMRLLKITPSKYRSLQMTRSAKYLNLELDNEENWKLILNSLEGRTLETEDKENGKVRIYIDDVHVHRLIERFVIEGGSSIDYTLNRNQLVLKYTEFLKLLDAIYQEAKDTPLINAINEDRSQLKVQKEFDSLDSVFKDLKDSLKDKTYDKIAEFALTTIIKIVRKKLSL